MENIDFPQPVKLILDQGRKDSLGIMNFRLARPGHQAQHHPVREICMEICYTVPKEMRKLMGAAKERDAPPLARQVFDLIIKNQDLAAPEGEYPCCQDTGAAWCSSNWGKTSTSVTLMA